MPVVQLRRQEQIQQSLISSVVSRTALTDVTDSSIIKHIIAAFARELDEVYYQHTRLSDFFSIDTAAGEDLDERAHDIQPGTLMRLQPARAIGNVVFSRQSTTGSVVIPAGTIIKAEGGVLARTTAAAKIDATSASQISGHAVGRDSNVVAATAVEPGVAGNVASGTLIKFGSKPSGVDEVTNVTAFTQGREKETDDEFRARLKSYIASLARSTVDTLEFVAIGIQDATTGKQCVYSHVEEDPITLGLVRLFIDDGNGTAESTTPVTGEVVIASALGDEEFLYLDHQPIKDGTVAITSSTRGALTLASNVYLNPASGLLYFSPGLSIGEQITADYYYYTGLIANVQRVIDGDPNDRLNYPGYRAAGILVRVLSPTVAMQPITAVLSVLDGFARDTVVSDVKDAITAYINTLGISGDVIRSELIQRIMEVPGVYDVNLTVPASNVTILDDQVARVNAALLSIS